MTLSASSKKAISRNDTIIQKSSRNTILTIKFFQKASDNEKYGYGFGRSSESEDMPYLYQSFLDSDLLRIIKIDFFQTDFTLIFNP